MLFAHRTPHSRSHHISCILSQPWSLVSLKSFGKQYNLIDRLSGSWILQGCEAASLNQSSPSDFCGLESLEPSHRFRGCSESRNLLSFPLTHLWFEIPKAKTIRVGIKLPSLICPRKCHTQIDHMSLHWWSCIPPLILCNLSLSSDSCFFISTNGSRWYPTDFWFWLAFRTPSVLSR